MALITSGSSTTPAALTFSPTCSGREAPISAAATLSFWSTQATASWAMVSPACSAIGCSCCTRPRTSSFMNRLTMSAPPFSSVAREPAGGCSPGLYLPVSTPWAIGLQTIWEMPSSREVGTTSSSMTRQSMEYCGWLEMSWKPSSLLRAWPARIWSAVHSLTPM